MKIPVDGLYISIKKESNNTYNLIISRSKTILELSGTIKELINDIDLITDIERKKVDKIIYHLKKFDL